MDFTLILIISLFVIALGTTIFFFSRYKKCPSDKIMVIYGKTGGGGRSSNCMHGGAAFIWPVIQAYEFLDLTPIKLDIKEQKFSQSDGTTIKLPARCTVGISTEPGVMSNAAERLLGQQLESVKDLAEDIIQSSITHVMDRTETISSNSAKIEAIDAIEARAAIELTKVGLKIISMELRMRLIES
ncbi:MAG: SPFH domain-containing protein [Candidatus Poribacteria bacterium]|nr:SPFH domain-containing protein [Candidatus Poribacteria bacterium]